MEQHFNEARRFILCSVRDLEEKKSALFVQKGRGLSYGWNSLAEWLRGLGVVPTGGLKETRVPEVPLRVKGDPKVL